MGGKLDNQAYKNKLIEESNQKIHERLIEEIMMLTFCNKTNNKQ